MMLFLELALIRWLGENVVFLSYFTNFVLLGSFLGIGLGFLSASARRDWFRWLPLSLFAIVAFGMLFPAQIDRSGSDVIFFGSLKLTGLPISIMLPVLFLGVTAIMAMVGQAVARTFSRFAPLRAYRLDIMGSILGIAGFTLLSWLRSPPLGWGVVVVVVVIWLGWGSFNLHWVASLAGLVILLGIQSFVPSYSWSPYYRVETKELAPDNIHISVNGIPHQAISTVASRRELEPIYFAPYDLVDPDGLDKVLIIGAGNGTDVAIALENGARSIDAVEIDPRLQELGASLHPDHPYQNPAVNVIINDGRAFMERSEGGYDLILFALPDSLTLVAGQSSLRLESFLFTEQAISRAAALLSPDGTFAMYNYYREDWLIERLARTVAEAHGSDPCVIAPDGGRGLALVAAGPNVSDRCPTEFDLDLATAPVPVTDDYPFLYVRERGIPKLYLTALAAILAASLLAVRASGQRLRTVGPNLDLLLMGAAFLLLETKSVVQFALWFGTTWVVNAMVFGGILLSVLAAIEVTRLGRLPRLGVLYGLLLASLAVAWLVPVGALLELDTVSRLLVGGVLTFSPIFLANLLFAQRFSGSSHSTTAFGVNLVGAMMGGLLEYTSLIVGYRALVLLVAALYAGAYLAWRRLGRQPEPAGELVAAA